MFINFCLLAEVVLLDGLAVVVEVIGATGANSKLCLASPTL